MISSCNDYIDSARRGVQWILKRHRADGSFFDADSGVGGYYKVPYALYRLGHICEAVSLLRWVRDHHFTSEGDFRAPARKASLSFHESWPSYANGWLIQSAHRLGEFDLSFRGAEFLLRYQTPCGGFIGLDNGQPYVDCLLTSMAGLTELTVGNRESASAAARCVKRFATEQPHPNRFCFRMTEDGRLITDVPPDAELGYYVDASRDKQIYFQPGLAIAFLSQWHRASGEKSSLQAAQTIFDFTQRCAEDTYAFPPSGKLGFGCAMLASITGRPEPRRAATKLADYLVRTQQDDGRWLLPDEELYAAIKDKEHPEVVVDLTAEFSVFLSEIAALI
jgi:hypothetical protein